MRPPNSVAKQLLSCMQRAQLVRGLMACEGLVSHQQVCHCMHLVTPPDSSAKRLLSARSSPKAVKQLETTEDR